MKFGVVLQTNPPAWRTVQLAELAEAHGFEYVWTFDSHLLWQEPYVIYSQILSRTNRVIVGPMVTNPATRDWTVTASIFATLNEMFGNRTVCGIGRGDSAVRVTNGKPTTVRDMREATHVIRELANCRAVDYNGSTIRFPWATHVGARGVDRGVRTAGAQGGGRGRRRLHPAAGRRRHRPLDDRGRPDRGEQRRARPDALTFCVAAPAYVGTDLPHMRDQSRWFGGMVGNHVADIVAKYGADSSVPHALTDYIKAREGYDYNEHGRAGNTHTAFVPGRDRRPLLPARHRRRPHRQAAELKALGVDQFSVYLRHDNKEETLRAYGETIIPALRDSVTARS